LTNNGFSLKPKRVTRNKTVTIRKSWVRQNTAVSYPILLS